MAGEGPGLGGGRPTDAPKGHERSNIGREQKVAQPAPIHLRMVLPPAPWTRAIEERRVGIPGVSWACHTGIDLAPDRFVASADRDVGENGVRRLVLDRLRGAPPTAIPVFLGREHMQRNILVLSSSPLTHPRDLVGTCVGSWLAPHSGTGAGVLMMLEQGYGIPLAEIEWRLGDPANLPMNRMGLRLGRGTKTVEGTIGALRSGEVDAIIVTLGPRHWSLFGPDRIHGMSGQLSDIRPLMSDPNTIADVYRRTGLYPITDLVVVAAGLPTRHPELPARLVGVFSEANALARDYMSADEVALCEREVELLGEAPHRYGLSPNARHNLATFIDFLYRMGALERPLDPTELFVPETL